MSSVHMTIEDIEKYLDTTDLSEEYLLWFESVQEHVEQCELCSGLINEMFLMQETCREENMLQNMHLLAGEDELRRSLLIAHLQMQLGSRQWLQGAIDNLRRNNLPKTSVYREDFRRGALGVARGNMLAVEDGVSRVFYRDSKVRVELPRKIQAEYMVVLNPEGGRDSTPQTAETIWDENLKCAVAEFEVIEPEDKYGIYFIEL